MKKARGYSILSTTDLAVQIAMQILTWKVVRKCRAYEVLVPVVSLDAQYVKGVQLNLFGYLC